MARCTQGAAVPSHSDTFSLPADSPVDVLVLGHGGQASSLTPDPPDGGLHPTVAFAQGLLDAGLDFHLGPVRAHLMSRPDIDTDGLFMADGGSGARGFLTPEDNATFTRDVIQAVQRMDEWSNSGRGACLEPALLALTPTLSDGPNAHFLRPGVPLAIWCINDRADFSSPIPTQDFTWRDEEQLWPVDYYLHSFLELKGRQTGLFEFHVTHMYASTGDCASNVEPPHIARGRIQAMVEKANGREQCSHDFVSRALPINPTGTLLAGMRRRFNLSSTPQPDSLAVSVNGQPALPGSWSYDSQDVSVVFAPDQAPVAGSVVTVEYGLACH